MRLLREPLVHFLFIGAAIYLAFGLFAEPVEDLQDDTLVVDAGEIEWMATSWYKRWNRMPTPQELDGLIQQYIRETVLYREALTMGLDLSLIHISEPTRPAPLSRMPSSA